MPNGVVKTTRLIAFKNLPGHRTLISDIWHNSETVTRCEAVPDFNPVFSLGFHRG
jgi:hypothetical protein